MSLTDDDLRAATGITIAACGTSWHAGLAGKFMIERLARLPVDVDYASEYRYRDPIPNPTDLGLLITQSGETADTIAAQQELIAKGSKTLAICNVVGSAVTRLAAGTITTNAGPEIGVASTKAFTAQLTALFTLALHLAQVRGPDFGRGVPPLRHRTFPHPRQARNRPPRRRRRLPRARQNPSPPPATSSSSAAASTTPSPSKAPSSSRKLATSTPKATPPAR